LEDILVDKITKFELKKEENNKFATEFLNSLEARGEITSDEKQKRLTFIKESHEAIYDPTVSLQSDPVN